MRALLLVLLLRCAALAGERLDEVVVSADRVAEPADEVPTHVTILRRDDVERSAAQTAADLLRQVPGFSLFRRSSSLVANPTTQGVSLRGLGASGASRSLVRLDGIPLNDPFGGWVYWSRVPLEALARIEVVEGGSATLWGNYGLGGVIDLTTRAPGPRGLHVFTEGGTRDTVHAELSATDRVGPFGLLVAGTHFDTGGYPVLRDDQRGPIDVDAFSAWDAFHGTVEWTPSAAARFHLRGNYLVENRGNGTPLTHNDTEAGTIAADGAWRTPDGSDWSGAVFGQLQTFASTFSTQASDRRSETPALDQFAVPSTSVGGSVQWVRTVAAVHLLTAGADVRTVDGQTDEGFRFARGAFTHQRAAGGEQQLAGAFVEDVWTPLPRLQLTGAGRLDVWRNAGGFRRESVLASGAVERDDHFADRTVVVLDPRLAARWALGPHAALRGAFYEAYRAPTLNELVRPFRVRNDITEANPGLDPERLIGGELGVDHLTDAARARLTGYWNEVEDPIANLTVGRGPGTIAPCGFVPKGGICRQRQNLGTLRVRGLESDVEIRPRPPLAASAGWVLADTEVLSAPGHRELVGKASAQIPRHQAVFRLAWERSAGPSAALQARWVGRQFEDDRNRIALGSFVVLDLFLGWRFRPSWQVFFRIENLLDRTYAVGRTADGLESVGAPLLAHGGVRAEF